MKPLFEMMAAYNRWMNKRLYAACSELNDEVRREDRGAFFRSIHGTFNHLVLTDRVWLGRFTGVSFVVASLDEPMADSWEELRALRVRVDDEIDAWLRGVDEAQLQSDLTVKPMSNPRSYSLSLWVCATHFFNHQTHHRGQITTLMEQIGCDSGVTDLPYSPAAIALRSSSE